MRETPDRRDRVSRSTCSFKTKYKGRGSTGRDRKTGKDAFAKRPARDRDKCLILSAAIRLSYKRGEIVVY